MFITAGIICLALLSSVAKASIGPIADLVISNKVISPDGFPRSAVLAGGTFPGPVIRGTKGNNFKLNVINQLTDKTMLRSTSIHWHGIFQTKTNFMDGPAFVTQCPIAANDSFAYEFRVPNQAGTFWYHSHLSTQYCDGLRGAFIVDDPLDPYRILYDVDNDSTIITLSDWYHEPAPSANGGPPLSPKSTLINGKGRYVGGPASELAVINVKKSKRYRFRIISTSCDPAFNFAIDGHMLTVIEADGEYTLPHLVDSIQVFAGQRYSVVMQADQPVGNYWVRANPDARGVPGFDDGRNSAILRYEGASVADPTTEYRSQKPLKETNLHTLFNPIVPGRHTTKGGADVNINIVHTFNFTTFHYEMNGATFIPPTVPVLLQILSGAQDARDLLPPGSVYALPPNKVIELSLPGTPFELGGPHPFHLHGHSFWVVRSADSTGYNYINPVRRDTVNTGFADSNATIRFVTDNAGPWFLHCHIDWHLELGLAVVFAEDIPTTKNMDPPPSWDNLCPRYNTLTPDQL